MVKYILMRAISSAGQSITLTLWRSQVRVPYRPPLDLHVILISMNNCKKSILILLGISFLFGIFDFHYQNTIYPLFNKLLNFLGGNENPLLLIPLFIYMLLPWYLLSLYALKVSKKENIFKFKVLVKNTVLAYLISVLSYYLHYIFLFKSFKIYDYHQRRKPKPY